MTITDRLSKILADSAYGKQLGDWALKLHQLIVEVVNVSQLAGFQVIPMRWKVERTFSWLNRFGAPMVPKTQ